MNVSSQAKVASLRNYLGKNLSISFSRRLVPKKFQLQQQGGEVFSRGKSINTENTGILKEIKHQQYHVHSAITAAKNLKKNEKTTFEFLID